MPTPERKMAILPPAPSSPPPPNRSGNSFVYRAFTDHFIYHVNVKGNMFAVTVTGSPSAADRWTHIVRNENLHNLEFGKSILAIGICAQVDPQLTQLATLQLCVGHRVLLFQLLHADSFPDSLRELLLEPTARFFTFRNADINRVLAEDRHAVELATMVIGIRPFLLKRYFEAPLQEITQGYLGYQVPRWTPEILQSQWGARTLSHQQILLATLDARISYMFGRLMYNLVP